jgi:hypothetical protein
MFVHFYLFIEVRSSQYALKLTRNDEKIYDQHYRGWFQAPIEVLHIRELNGRGTLTNHVVKDTLLLEA